MCQDLCTEHSLKLELERNIVFGKDFPKVRIDWVPRFSHLGFYVVESGGRATCRSGKFLSKNARWVVATAGKSCLPCQFLLKGRRRQNQNPAKRPKQRKKPQVQCNTWLIYLCREVWRSFWFIWGTFQSSAHKRNWSWSTTVTNMKAYTKGGLPVKRATMTFSPYKWRSLYTWSKTKNT